MIASPQALSGGEAAGQGAIVGTSFGVMTSRPRGTGLRSSETLQSAGAMTGTMLDGMYRRPRRPLTFPRRVSIPKLIRLQRRALHMTPISPSWK